MLREIIWLIIAALFVYVVFQIYRVIRLESGKRVSGPAAPAPAPTPAPGPRLSDQDDGMGGGRGGDDDEDVEDEDDDVFVFDARPRMPSSPWAASERGASSPATEDFQQTLELQHLRRDMAQLRTEMSAQREELAAVRTDLRTMKEQLEATLASQGVSPEYNEALVFARRGLDAESISERCGISMAEAELVRSLASGGGRNSGDAR